MTPVRYKLTLQRREMELREQLFFYTALLICFSIASIDGQCPPKYECMMSSWMAWNTACPPCEQRLRTRIKGICCSDGKQLDACATKCGIPPSQWKQQDACPIPSGCLTGDFKIIICKITIYLLNIIISSKSWCLRAATFSILLKYLKSNFLGFIYFLKGSKNVHNAF